MRLAIVGAGLIGASVALAARRADPEARIVSLDRGDSLDGIGQADLVVLSAPVQVITDLLREPRVFGDAVVTDVGSTKRVIVRAAREAGLLNFVGGHPMAGGTTSGPGAARADLFDGRPWFLLSDQAAPQAVETVRQFVEGLGARPVVLDDDGGAHDRLMAAISHLPQLAATALMNVIGDATGVEALEWAGAGCRDTTRLAGSSAAMWESVLATNADVLRPLVTALTDELRRIAGDLESAAETRRHFDKANIYRQFLERS